jgi:hypothetical protein
MAANFLKLDEKTFKFICEALIMRRQQMEDFFHKSEQLFGPQEEQEITEKAWEKFQEADNIHADLVNGKFDNFGEEEVSDEQQQ